MRAGGGAARTSHTRLVLRALGSTPRSVLLLCHHHAPIDRVGWLNIQRDGLACQRLDENLLEGEGEGDTGRSLSTRAHERPCAAVTEAQEPGATADIVYTAVKVRKRGRPLPPTYLHGGAVPHKRVHRGKRDGSGVFRFFFFLVFFFGFFFLVFFFEAPLAIIVVSLSAAGLR